MIRWILVNSQEFKKTSPVSLAEKSKGFDIDDADNGLGVEIESSNSCTGNDRSKQFTLASSLIYYILYFTI